VGKPFPESDEAAEGAKKGEGKKIKMGERRKNLFSAQHIPRSTRQRSGDGNHTATAFRKRDQSTCDEKIRGNKGDEAGIRTPQYITKANRHNAPRLKSQGRGRKNRRG